MLPAALACCEDKDKKSGFKFGPAVWGVGGFVVLVVVAFVFLATKKTKERPADDRPLDEIENKGGVRAANFSGGNQFAIGGSIWGGGGGDCGIGGC